MIIYSRKSLIVQLGSANPRVSYALCESTLSVNTEFRDLGLGTDDKLSFKRHVLEVRLKTY